MPTEIYLFIDWNSAFRIFRPTKPLSEPTRDVKIQKNFLAIQNLREHISKIVAPDTDYIVDAFIYGGFSDTEGKPTESKELLTEALAKNPWKGLLRKCRFREIELSTRYTIAPNSQTVEVNAQFRPNDTIRKAHFFPFQETCNCDWMQKTDSWLKQSRKRICPVCQEENKAQICHPTEKLVDTLLVAHALEIAIYRSADSTTLENTEIWICSPDADIITALPVIANLGICSVWLQPQENTKYGYRDALSEYSVQTKDIKNG